MVVDAKAACPFCGCRQDFRHSIVSREIVGDELRVVCSVLSDGRAQCVQVAVGLTPQSATSPSDPESPSARSRNRPEFHRR
jgi:hypothetical protein